jgi:hypothetical protein
MNLMGHGPCFLVCSPTPLGLGLRELPLFSMGNDDDRRTKHGGTGVWEATTTIKIGCSGVT